MKSELKQVIDAWQFLYPKRDLIKILQYLDNIEEDKFQKFVKENITSDRLEIINKEISLLRKG